MDQFSIVNMIAVTLAMAAAAAIPALLPRLPIPGLVLEIGLGVMTGPQVLGIVHPRVTSNFLANFGVGMLFLMAGFEVDPAVLKGRRARNTAWGWTLTLVARVLSFFRHSPILQPTLSLASPCENCGIKLCFRARPLGNVRAAPARFSPWQPRRIRR